MSDLKIKVLVGNVNVELEGNSEEVKDLFNSLKKDGIGSLENYIYSVENRRNENENNILERKINTTNISSEVVAENNDTDYNDEIPAINNLVLSGGPDKESDWLLVYAFYCSNYGKKLFTKEEVRQMYKETGRYTTSRTKNFSTNIKRLVTDKYISAVNDSDFRIEKNGIELVMKIISGEVKSKGKETKNKGGKKTQPENYELVDLSLTEKDRNDFMKYFQSHKNTVKIDQVILIAKWLKDNKQIKEIDKNIVFTMLRNIEESTSFNIAQAILNAKKKNYFIDGEEKTKFVLYHIGEDHIKRDLVKDE